jgi:hypothetical protein
MNTITGTFQVVPSSQSEETVDGISFQELSLDKQFEGPLKATSTVKMLAASSQNGAGGYVAREHVDATLDGKKGSFVLLHTGLREGEKQELTLQVVPGCSTGELEGLEGRMKIDMKAGQHSYTFEYSL